MTKQLSIPFIKDFSHSALELEGARFDVRELNWPEQFPYAPFCSGRIARTEDTLWVDFRVSGLDLRACNTQDNGHQWEDSCVEAFFLDPTGQEYYNFEINALGKVLACRGKNREGRQARPAEEMAQIQRFAQLEGGPLELTGLHSWRVCVGIPFGLIGLSPGNLPTSIRANFYKCGDKTAHPHFLSWSPITTPKPDFHRPEFFGELIFQ